MLVIKEVQHEAEITDMIERYIWRRYTKLLDFPRSARRLRSQFYMDIGWSSTDFKRFTMYSPEINVNNSFSNSSFRGFKHMIDEYTRGEPSPGGSERTFTKTTLILLPRCKLPVTLCRLSDRKQIRTFWIDNLNSVFEEVAGFQPMRIKHINEVIDTDESGVYDVYDVTSGMTETICKFVTTGVCKSRT